MEIEKILALFGTSRVLDSEKAGVSQLEFNRIAEFLKKKGYAKLHKEEGAINCEVVELNKLGIEAKSKLK